MKYEIVNPSDPYTLETDNLEAAAVACFFLGSGKYALTDEEGNQAVPFFLFGGHDEWFKEHFGYGFEESIDRVDKQKLVEALESVSMGSEKRSSLNDIGGRAKDFATECREKYLSATA